MGGAMAIATDEAGIQFRILNSSKGPLFVRRALKLTAFCISRRFVVVSKTKKIWIFQQAVDDLMVEGDRVVGACDSGWFEIPVLVPWF